MPWTPTIAHPWWRRAAFAALFVLLLWALMAVLVPPWLKAQVEREASLALGRAVSIEAVSLRPWSLELTVDGLAIAGPGAQASAPPQLSLRRLYIDAELQSLWRRAPVVDAVRAEGLSVRLTHLGAGRLDVDDIRQHLAARTTPAEASAQPLRFALYNLAIDGFEFELRDEAVGQTHRLSDGLLQLPFLSNLPKLRDVTVAPRLAFNVAGARFDSQAEGTPFATQRQGEVRIRLPDLDLKPFFAYWPAALPVKPEAARLDLDLNLAFEQTPQAAVRLRGQFGLRDVDLRAAKGQPLVAWRALQVQLQDVRPLEQVVLLDTVRLEGAQVQARRDPTGRIDLLHALTGAAANPKAPRAASPASGAQASAAPAPPGRWRIGVSRLEVADAALQWRDAAVQPVAALAVERVELQVDQLQWPQQAGEKARWAGGAQVLAVAAQPGPQAPQPSAARAAARLSWAGEGGLWGGATELSMDKLPLSLAGPYLRQVLLAPLVGDLSFKAQLQWGGDALAGQQPAGSAPRPQAQAQPAAGSDMPWVLSFTELALDRVRLQDPQAQAREPAALQWQRLALSDVRLDSSQRLADVGTVRWLQPRAALARLADGRLWFEPWLTERQAPPTGSPEAATGTASASTRSADAGAAAPWRWRLALAVIEGGELSWRDDAVPRPVPVRLTGVRAELRSLGSAERALGSLNISTQVQTPNGEPGRLQWRGQMGLAPMRLQGSLAADELPLRAASPYVSQHLNLDVLRGALSVNGRLGLAQPASPLAAGGQVGWQVSWQGDAGLDDFMAHTMSTSDGVAPSQELLSWRTLALRGVDLRLQPEAPVSLQVQGTTLADFYARIVVNRQGRLNLQELQSAPAPQSPSGPSSAAPTEAASAPPALPLAPAAAAAAPVATTPAVTASAVATPVATTPAATAPAAPRIRFGPVQLVNGRVAFSDQFIQPNYSASLTELNGQLSAFASASIPDAPQLAELVLTGRAEGTASLDVSGRLNPLLAPLALDIRAKVRDLELSPLSPYSVKYAGHGIERGKLSMDVAYRISPQGQLEASNQIVLNQLTFGDKVEGAPSSLPVRLAVALLADRNGVIDINLPISGSLNDPEFRLAPIIFRVVVNLIVKAVTAPFSLLASAFGGGGGDELSVVAFSPGSAVLDDAALQTLDKVAQALAQRPALRMTVVGTASLEVEREAWRRERLRALVLAERRRATLAAGPAASAAAGSVESASAMDAQTYARWLREAYRRADVPKPRNLVGLARDLPVPEMEALLMAAMSVNEEAMRSLAVQRGVAVRDHLMARNVPAERLFLGAARAVPPEAKWSPRAQLELSMK